MRKGIVMIEKDELSKKELQRTGEIVLSTININLFNAKPTIHKAYQIYSELVQFGYLETDKELACSQIVKFFEKRTLKNQGEIFYKYFKIPFNQGMRNFLTLSFRTAEIDTDEVKKISIKVCEVLNRAGAIQNYGIGEPIIFSVISELYNPKYFEPEWRITISHLFKKIKRMLMQSNRDMHLDDLEEIFNLLDPESKGRKSSALSLVENLSFSESSRDRNFETGARKVFNPDAPCLTLSHEDGADEIFANNLLAIKRAIKEAEIVYVKKILETLKDEISPDYLDTNLYTNENRHPVIASFFNSVKNYNLILKSDDLSVAEMISELRIIANSIRDNGEIILCHHQAQIEKTAGELGIKLKKIA